MLVQKKFLNIYIYIYKFICKSKYLHIYAAKYLRIKYQKENSILSEITLNIIINQKLLENNTFIKTQFLVRQNANIAVLKKLEVEIFMKE